jgi:peptide-methionine (S)-S-oxide reductase
MKICYYKKMEKATFGAGCFWGVEAAFSKVKGVVSTTAGYAGGHAASPTYKEVCTGRTGHAEVVQVEYDPKKISYEDLLEIFFDLHDPTTRNRQGPDIGTQYRSVIFCHSPEQEKKAREYKQKLEGSGRFGDPIVTEIAPAESFYKAEEYHQKYHEKHGGSCDI